MNNSNQEPLVLILMGTFDGERFIREQLDSIAAQTHKNWKLFISDDGSSDKTLEIARQWAKEVGEGRVRFKEGPRQGFAQNFLSMACDPSLKADFYAFSDQDDVWCPEKLEAALKWVRKEGRCDKPILYCGRTTYVTADLKPYAESPLFQKPPGFKNAIVQSLAGGNTMVFNQQTKNLVEAVGLVPAVSHDWWLYQLVTGASGFVVYDGRPQLLYRQHGDSLIGGNNSISAKLKGAKMALTGRFKEYNDRNLVCIQKAFDLLSTENRKIILKFSEARNQHLLKRLLSIYRLKIFRQTRSGMVSLYLIAALKKI